MRIPSFGTAADDCIRRDAVQTKRRQNKRQPPEERGENGGDSFLDEGRIYLIWQRRERDGDFAIDMFNCRRDALCSR